MHPILIKLGPFAVYSYGAMVAAGFAVSLFFIYRRAPKFGIDREKAVDLTVFMLIFGIIGARAFYVLLNLPHYAANPVEIIMLSKGGLVWYGGFILDVVVMAVYLKVCGISFASFVDLVCPYVALAQCFGRIGCYLNGCCYGVEVAAGFPLAVRFPGDCADRFPSQLVSAALLFLIFVVLRLLQDRARFGLEVFLAYCALYSAKRFGVEFLRGDNPKLLAGLTVSQIISACIFTAAAVVFIIMVKRCKKDGSVSK